MRRFLTGVAVSFLALASLLGVLAQAATADPSCQVIDPRTGQCTIVVEPDPEPPPPPAGGDGPEQTGSGSPCYWDPAPQGLSGPPAGPVPCTTEYGNWSNANHCYIQLAAPQPPAGSPDWQGHEPGDGAVYQCYQPQTDLTVYIWAANPPPGSGGGITPGEVAQIAVDQMHLSAINIGIVPEPGADSVGLVGMPVWMWADNPDADTFGPVTASASAGGITVTATAKVEKVTWLMGDGAEVVCSSAGTPYRASFGMRPSPDCGHIYERSSAGEPNDRYTVTALTDWVVRWQGGGQTGVMPLDGLERSVQIAVGEAQVLVSRASGPPERRLG
jgi:hypothetical protein